jgi:hypothetical protein
MDLAKRYVSTSLTFYTFTSMSVATSFFQHGLRLLTINPDLRFFPPMTKQAAARRRRRSRTSCHPLHHSKWLRLRAGWRTRWTHGSERRILTAARTRRGDAVLPAACMPCEPVVSQACQAPSLQLRLHGRVGLVRSPCCSTYRGHAESLTVPHASTPPRIVVFLLRSPGPCLH